MALTFITPAGELAGTNTPVVFTLDREAISITVEYLPLSGPAQDWLTVYGATDVTQANGRFAWKFSTSSRVGNTWTVRPPVNDGIWKARIRLIVDEVPEVPEIPTSGQKMGTVYRVDFTAMDARSFATTGVHVIDGKNWYLKGAFTNSGGVIESSSLVPGSGLRITSNFQLVSSGDGSAKQYLHWFCPTAQFADYNPLAPLMVWARLKTTPNSVTAAAYVGLGDGTSDATGITAAHRAKWTLVGVASNNSGINNYLKVFGNAGGANSVNVGTQSTLNDGGELVGVQELSPSMDMLKGTLYSADAVDPFGVEDHNINTSAFIHWRTTNPRTNAGVYFAINFNGGATWNFDLMELRLMQPKVAA